MPDHLKELADLLEKPYRPGDIYDQLLDKYRPLFLKKMHLVFSDTELYDFEKDEIEEKFFDNFRKYIKGYIRESQEILNLNLWIEHLAKDRCYAIKSVVNETAVKRLIELGGEKNLYLAGSMMISKFSYDRGLVVYGAYYNTIVTVVNSFFDDAKYAQFEKYDICNSLIKEFIDDIIKHGGKATNEPIKNLNGWLYMCLRRLFTEGRDRIHRPKIDEDLGIGKYDAESRVNIDEVSGPREERTPEVDLLSNERSNCHPVNDEVDFNYVRLLEGYLDILRKRNSAFADFLQYDILEKKDDKELAMIFGHTIDWVRNTRRRAKIELVKIVKDQKEELVLSRYRTLFHLYGKYWNHCERKVILEFYLVNKKSIEEIAELLGRTPRNINQIISEAIIELNKIVNKIRQEEGYEDEEGKWHKKTIDDDKMDVDIIDNT